MSLKGVSEPVASMSNCFKIIRPSYMGDTTAPNGKEVVRNQFTALKIVWKKTLRFRIVDPCKGIQNRRPVSR